MKKLMFVVTFLFIYNYAQAGNMADEGEVKAAFKILLANQNIHLSKSELCKPSDSDKTIGDLIAKTLSFAIADKDHKTNLTTQCQKVNIKGMKLLDCKMSIVMPTREGASSSFRYTVNPATKTLIEDSLRCY